MNRLVRVRVDDEWAECVVLETDKPVQKIEGEQEYFSATFMAHSSYGTYGHYWSSMGCPFGQFAEKLNQGYLLSKLSQSRPDLFQYTQAINGLIRKHVVECVISDTNANRCKKIVDREEDRSIDPNTIIYNLSNNMTLIQKLPGFEGISAAFYPGDAVNFVEKIWPAFVKAYNDPAMPLETLKET